MPNYRKHLIGGCATYAILICVNAKYNLIKIESIVQLQTLAACLIGSLFPDVDTKSKIQKLIYLVILIAATHLLITGQQFWAAITLMISLIPLISNHRGLFHRLWFIGICMVLVNFFCYINQPSAFKSCITLSIFFMSGTISHIWLDLGWRRLWK